MVFEDIVAVLERAFKLELSVVQGRRDSRAGPDVRALPAPEIRVARRARKRRREEARFLHRDGARVEPLDSRFPSVERSRGFSWRFWRNSSVTFPGFACIQVAGKVQKKKRRT